MTDDAATPTTEAGRDLVKRIYGGRMRPREDFEALRRDILAIEAEARAAALRDTAGIDVELGQALAFAASVIKSGEPWTATCEEIIGGALRRARLTDEAG